MPSDSGKASEKELEARNLQAIQRIDPCAKAIMDKVAISINQFIQMEMGPLEIRHR